ncbi:hypothetical protein PWW31_17860 [Vibrio harveyi]|nr:hypothetical protein PWW31_17860 [Vibrio harveyi]
MYLRHAFFEREKPRWSQSYHHSNADAALKRGDLNRLSQEIAKDIKESAKEFKVEAKFAEWKVDGGKFHEWKSTQKYLTESGETRFAISPEAQLLRWGAQASVATVFEPTNGRVDIGIGAEYQCIARRSQSRSQSLPSVRERLAHPTHLPRCK